jgi:hypothetical protein
MELFVYVGLVSFVIALLLTIFTTRLDPPVIVVTTATLPHNGSPLPGLLFLLVLVVVATLVLMSMP